MKFGLHYTLLDIRVASRFILLYGVRHMRENILGKENITILFLKYSIPTIAAMLFLGLNSIVDGLFVGNYVGANALASINIAMPFISFILAFSVVVGIGTQSIIGRKLGEGNITEANIAFKTALLLVGGISVIFAVVAIGFTAKIAGFLGANEFLLPQVTTYIRYLSLFLPFLGVMMVLDYVLKAVAKPVYAMLALVVAVISHMLFNCLFIVKLALGIKGAALATGLGYSVALGMAVLPFVRGQTLLKLLDGRFDKNVAGHIIYSGSSEGLTEVGTGITTFLFNITLMRYVGEMGVAAFSIINYLAFIGNNVLLGLSDGVGAIISYNYGSRQMNRVKRTLQLAAATAFVIGAGMFIAISVFSKEVISLFLDTDKGHILTFAVHGAKLYAFAFLVNGLNIVTCGYFTAIGIPKHAAMVAISKGIVLIVLGILTLPVILGIGGIWLTVPIAESITVILSAILVYRQFNYQVCREVK